MEIIILIIWLIAVYLALTLIIPAAILPNYFLIKPSYKITSKKLKKVIKNLNKIRNDEEFVKASFKFITARYKSAGPITFILNLPRLFWHNPNKVIEEQGFAFCHVQNLMLKTILTGSKRFSDSMIKTKINFTLVIHQYLEVSLGKKRIELDPYGFGRGIPHGKHLNTMSFLFRPN
ncbi:MAG: hypothetical protein ABH864_05380 [archaeon]